MVSALRVVPSTSINAMTGRGPCDLLTTSGRFFRPHDRQCDAPHMKCGLPGPVAKLVSWLLLHNYLPQVWASKYLPLGTYMSMPAGVCT
jgi:hypothetical protein